MKYFQSFLAAGVCAVMLGTAFTGCAPSKEPSASSRTIRFAVSDIEGLQRLQTNFEPFRRALETASGLKFEFYAVNSRTVAVEALRSKMVDLVIAGPAEYVVIEKRTNARPLVGFSRPGYCSAIITTRETGIQDLAGLKGKKIAFGDVGSTSRHLTPMQMLADAGLDPLKDVTSIHTSKIVMHEALLQGDVSAMAQSYQNWVELQLSKEPKEVQDRFVVLAKSDPLPDDVLIVGNHIDEATTDKIKQAFNAHGKELMAALTSTESNAKYQGIEFRTDVEDKDYDPIRTMYATIGYPEYSEFIGES